MPRDKDIQSKPALQLCDCGAEWFFVHNCPLKAKSVPVKETVDFRLKYKSMVEELISLRKLCRDQEHTITDLMLELAELREAKQEQGQWGLHS
jgi:hypothetical protein